MLIRIVKHMSISLCIRVAGVGLMFVAQILIARSLSTETYGIFSYFFLCIPIVSQLMDIGFRTSALRYVTKYKNQPALKRGFIIYAFLLCIVLGALITLAGFIMGWTASFTPAFDYMMRYVLWVAGAYALLQLAIMILNAEHLIFTSQSLGQVVSPLLLITAAIIGQLHPSWANIDGITAGYAVSIVVPALLACLLVLKRMPAAHDGDISYSREWVAHSIPMGISTTAVTLMARMDIVILGLLVSPALVAVYAVIHRIGNLCLFPFQAVGVVTAPHLATMCHEHDSRNLRALLKNVILVTIGISLGLLAAIIMLGDHILALFGQSYAHYHTMLICFSVIYFFRLSAWPINQIPNIVHKQTEYMGLVIGVVIVMAVLFPPAIHLYGLYGALAVSGVGTMLFNIGLIYMLSRIPVLRN